ncbi:MAG: hypothetical protein KAK04_04050 [Cyclobacteriaceae bacterium]|nr:hypothetical protein [Cyclobacteriaceae bacterium]
MANKRKLESIAQLVNWFESPDLVISNTNKFLCYAMKFALAEDINILMQHYGKEAFRGSMRSIYANILDKRSKSYFELITKD